MNLTLNLYALFKKYEIYVNTFFKQKMDLVRNSAHWKERYIVCIRWNFIKQDIIDFKKKGKDETGL